MSECEKSLCRSYADVGFYEPWLLFSNFKVWFDENYIEGYVLDKKKTFSQVERVKECTRQIHVALYQKHLTTFCKRKRNRDRLKG